MNKLSSEEGGGFHEEVLQKYTGGALVAGPPSRMFCDSVWKKVYPPSGNRGS